MSMTASKKIAAIDPGCRGRSQSSQEAQKSPAAATAQRLKEKRERADRKRGRRPPKWDD